MTLAGAKRLDRALAKLEEDATDEATAKAAGELILFDAQQRSRSRRVRRTGRVSTRRRRGQVSAVVKFGSRAVPFTAASHFGHGSPSSPRPQGGWMPANPFLFDARDQRADEVHDLFLRRTRDAILQAF